MANGVMAEGDLTLLAKFFTVLFCAVVFAAIGYVSAWAYKLLMVMVSREDFALIVAAAFAVVGAISGVVVCASKR